MTVFNLSNVDYNQEPMFFGSPLSIARYDKQKYSIFEKLTEKQQGFFWRPSEVDLLRDSKDFKSLSNYEKHIFTSNLKRQILLDSVQGRAPVEVFLPITSLPEIENWVITWSFFETIHSRSYTHIIRNVYSDPSKVFDELMDVQEICECAEDITKYYDALLKNPKDKKALWLCLNAVNALEGIRFYVSFACSWAFAELKKMEGNAKIIKFIARDENVHLAATQHMIKLLLKEDNEYVKIKEECEAEVKEIFENVVQQEKKWAKYLFKDGSMIGLNEELLCEYVDWISHKRASAVGIDLTHDHKISTSNPLPWTQKWISGGEVQVAPQETEITSYIVGGVKKDIDTDTFKGFQL